MKHPSTGKNEHRSLSLGRCGRNIKSTENNFKYSSMFDVYDVRAEAGDAVCAAARAEDRQDRPGERTSQQNKSHKKSSLNRERVNLNHKHRMLRLIRSAQR